MCRHKGNLGPAPLQKCVGEFWRILPGIFLEDFLGTFSHKNKKSGGQKIKIRKKSVLPKTDPKKSPPQNERMSREINKQIEQAKEVKDMVRLICMHVSHSAFNQRLAPSPRSLLSDQPEFTHKIVLRPRWPATE